MAIVDIRCPECGRTEPVYKSSIGQYRCTECDREFTPADVRPDGG